MSQLPPSPASTDDLQFTTVEPAVAAGTATRQSGQVCLGCKRPIESTYFAIAGKVVCPKCAERIQAPPGGSGAIRVAKATIMGLGAGLVGALVWFAIRRFAHLQIGLVAIAVGFMIGKAVRKGSGGRGGRGYQVLALVLTYCCIAANYMPDVLEALMGSAHNSTVTPVLIVFAFGYSLALPFLSGAQNFIGLLIIGFALWQAWKLTARRRLPITGPYYIAQPDFVAGAPAAPASADSEVII